MRRSILVPMAASDAGASGASGDGTEASLKGCEREQGVADRDRSTLDDGGADASTAFVECCPQARSCEEVLEVTAGVARPDEPQDGHICLTSPYLEELMLPQLREIIDEYDVDGIWIDADVWLAAPCYCERCQRTYREEVGSAPIPRATEDDGWDEWLGFHRRLYEQHVRSVATVVHDRKPNCALTINWAYTLLQPEPTVVQIVVEVRTLRKPIE